MKTSAHTFHAIYLHIFITNAVFAILIIIVWYNVRMEVNKPAIGNTYIQNDLSYKQTKFIIFLPTYRFYRHLSFILSIFTDFPFSHLLISFDSLDFSPTLWSFGEIHYFERLLFGEECTRGYVCCYNNYIVFLSSTCVDTLYPKSTNFTYGTNFPS